jgi:hypothetical protein
MFFTLCCGRGDRYRRSMLPEVSRDKRMMLLIVESERITEHKEEIFPPRCHSLNIKLSRRKANSAMNNNRRACLSSFFLSSRLLVAAPQFSMLMVI